MIVALRLERRDSRGAEIGNFDEIQGGKSWKINPYFFIHSNFFFFVAKTCDITGGPRSIYIYERSKSIL